MTTPAILPDAALEARVGAFLRQSAPAVAPPGLLDATLRRLDAGPAARGRTRPGGLLRSPEWLGLGLTAAFVVLAVVGVFALGGRSPGGPGAGAGAASAPDYDGIRFQADGLAIDAGGQVFTLDPATAAVASDQGDPTRRTLEWTWQQHGVEMRLNLYLASDGATWWASEIRTYDGLERGGWLTATGRFFERPLGSAYEGPVDMALADADAGSGIGRIRIDRLVLLPTFTAVQPSWTAGPVSGGDGGPAAALDPFAPGQLLNCMGAETMTPQELALYARTRGYPVEYRYLKDGSSAEEEPPPGSLLTDALWGSAGQLIIMASAPAEPVVDQVRLTAERACPGNGRSK